MSKILRKAKYDGFIELDSEEPKLGADGSIIVRLGNGSNVSNFKLTADEARAVRDALGKFLDSHDEQVIKLFKQEGYSNVPEAFSASTFSIFDTPDAKPAPVEKKPEFFYY